MAGKKNSDNSKTNSWDVIVVGAGIVGSYFARRMAEKGRKVLLIDSREGADLGSWKNSGHNIDKIVFDRLPIRHPSEDEIGAQVDTAEYDSPSGQFTFDLPMYNVRLGPFTQRMLDDAIEEGVEFMDKTACESAIVENGSVVGIKAKQDGKSVEYRAALTVDVSGVGAVVRNSLPDEMGMEKGHDPENVINVYSEDREVGMDNWPVPFTYHSRFQGWCGSRRPGVIGIGLGRFASTGEDPRDIHPEFVKYAMPVPGKTIFKTYQPVPVRHPLHKMAGNGVMVIGDAAYQGKPLNGEGLSVMLESAEMAADVAGRAFYREDLSEKSLWPYTRRWHRNFGARFSMFHRIRYEALKLTKDDQDFMMGLGLYGPKEMSTVMLEGKIEIGLMRMLRMVGVAYRGRSRPGLLKRLTIASMEGAKLKKLYEQYPDNPAELPTWVNKVMALYHKD